MSSAYHPYKEIIFLISKKRGGVTLSGKNPYMIHSIQQNNQKEKSFHSPFFGRVEERFTAVKQGIKT